jgi:hypothetical protein
MCRVQEYVANQRRTLLNNGNISPGGKWKIIEDNQVKWVELTKPKYQYTLDEVVKATKNIKSDLW